MIIKFNKAFKFREIDFGINERKIYNQVYPMNIFFLVIFKIF